MVMSGHEMKCTVRRATDHVLPLPISAHSALTPLGQFRFDLFHPGVV
jgi:hypothetical protein